MIKKTLNEIKANLKPSHLIALFVTLAVLALIAGWLSKRSALVARVNPLPVK